MKILLALIGATMALVPVSSASAPAALRTIDYGAIVMVRCGPVQGTAFHIGGGRYVTAYHVAAFGNCAIAGVPARMVRADGGLDVAELGGPAIGLALRLDCRGFRAGGNYRAVGYAMPAGRLTLPLIATRHMSDGQREFVGEVYPGMSGGPVIADDGGEVAGITNRRWPARSRALRGTWLCEGRRA